MALRNPAIVAVLCLSLLLIPTFASAATGGRVGGSSFGKSKTSTSSSSSSSSWSSDSSYRYRYYPQPTYRSTPPSPPAASSSSSDGDYFTAVFGLLILSVVIVFLVVLCDACTDLGLGKLSVVKHQVGLMGEAQSVQRNLNRITENAMTSTPKGLSHVLTGATTALLHNLNHCISCDSSVVTKFMIENAEACFKLLSMEDAAKFDEVTLANVNNFRTRSHSQSPNEIHKEYMVVTILVAAEGLQKLPTINGTRDLKKALQELGSIPSSKLMAVEVLWTPQQENDTLTQRELLKGYSNLRGFYEEASEQRPSDLEQPFLGAKVV